jgi:hypothetical protein
MRIEVTRTVVPGLFEKLDQKEQRLHRLRGKAEVLVEPARLLVVQVDVKQLAGFDRLRNNVVAVQAHHLLVRNLRVDANHIRVVQRGNERQIRGGRREIDIAARLVRLGFESKAERVFLIARVLAQEVDGVAKSFDGFDRVFRPRLPLPLRDHPRRRMCRLPARRPDPSLASSSAGRRRAHWRRAR